MKVCEIPQNNFFYELLMQNLHWILICIECPSQLCINRDFHIYLLKYAILSCFNFQVASILAKLKGACKNRLSPLLHVQVSSGQFTFPHGSFVYFVLCVFYFGNLYTLHLWSEWSVPTILSVCAKLSAGYMFSLLVFV